MDGVFLVLGSVTVAGAVAAMSLRNLVHCAFALAVCLAGLACLYLRLDAQFVGLAQILVYIGAVAILIVFAILLTGSGGEPPSASWNRGNWAGVGVAVLIFGTLSFCIVSSAVTRSTLPAERTVSVRELGERMMTEYVLALEAIGLLLTVALIGAVIIAMQRRPGRKQT